MNSLETTFAGISLRNPIIVSSSGLTDAATKCQALDKAGAGAIVLKSIFEEQIMQQYDRYSDPNNPEGNDYLNTYLTANSLNTHTMLIKEAKRLCSIPIIASINCSSTDEWTTFAQTVEEAGADAIEINIMEVQTSLDYSYGAYEQKHIDILSRLRKHTHLPIIFKLERQLTNPIALINQLYAGGAAGIVLFNRPYRPDINIDNGNFTAGEMWTRPSDICDALRWTGIASARIPQIDYAISGGVHDGWAAVKAILTGASAVEVCTTLFWNGPQRIEVMLQQMKQWMEERGLHSINQFRARMNAYAAEGSRLFERTQFMKYFSSYRR